MGELRAANPEVFINPSSGTWASPFWLLRADSIWRGGGDTGIAGAKGSERQQWITYRDFEVHNRVLVNGPLYPISSLMIHGIMINSGGRVKTFDEPDMIDEIRSFFASGVNLQELYVTPDVDDAGGLGCAGRGRELVAGQRRRAGRHALDRRRSGERGDLRLGVVGQAERHPLACATRRISRRTSRSTSPRRSSCPVVQQVVFAP